MFLSLHYHRQCLTPHITNVGEEHKEEDWFQKENLVSLSAGLLYYGKIWSVDIWQMLAFMTVINIRPAASCFSPFATLYLPHITE
jgi:hypothetical protein